MIDIQSQFARLDELGVEYAFYFKPQTGEAIHIANRVHFHSASLLKVPILLAWLRLESLGQVSREEIGDLDSEPEVRGAGYSWLLKGRKIPFNDALLMMIALSDNLCTNLVIQRLGLEKLNRVIREDLGLFGCRLERKLYDFEARARGLDNWITAEDCVHLYDLIEELPRPDRVWVESLLEVNQDDGLFKRSIPRDTIIFYHKTGSLPNVIHDWGYTSSSRLFLLTHGVVNEPATFEVFGELGKLLLEP